MVMKEGSLNIITRSVRHIVYLDKNGNSVTVEEKDLLCSALLCSAYNKRNTRWETTSSNNISLGFVFRLQLDGVRGGWAGWWNKRFRMQTIIKTLPPCQYTVTVSTDVLCLPFETGRG